MTSIISGYPSYTEVVDVVLLTFSAVAFLLALGVPIPGEAPESPLVAVRVTQKYLEPLGLNGAPVKRAERSGRVGLKEHSLTFTMRNEPHHNWEHVQHLEQRHRPACP